MVIGVFSGTHKKPWSWQLTFQRLPAGGLGNVKEGEKWYGV